MYVVYLLLILFVRKETFSLSKMSFMFALLEKTGAELA